MRRFLLPLRTLPVLVLGLSFAIGSCSSTNGPNDGNNLDEDAGDTPDGDSTPGKTITFGNRLLVDDQEAGLAVSLAATPDNQFAVGYIKWGQATDTCLIPGHMTPSEVSQDFVRYAWFDGTTWSHEDVTPFTSVFLSGVSLVFDGNTPTMAFLAGATPQQCCGGGDLIIARRNGAASWTQTTAAANSGDAAAGADCPIAQSQCDTGDLVGLWPSLTKDNNGGLGVVWRDIHLCYAKEDQDKSDLEFASSPSGGGAWSPHWVQLGNGSGSFNSLAFGTDNEPAVVSYVGKTGAIAFSRRQAGAWTPTPLPTCATNSACTDKEQADCQPGERCVQFRCTAVVDCLDQALPEDSLSLKVGPDGRYLVAYYDVDTQKLRLAHSTDGLTWTTGIVDSQDDAGGSGNTGMSPTLLVDKTSGQLSIVYYRCGAYSAANPTCERAHDGVMMAFFNGAYPDDLTTANKWKKVVVDADSNAFDGAKLSAALKPDGSVGVAYSYVYTDPISTQTKRQLMFQLGTWK